jgi:hypothetical protein
LQRDLALIIAVLISCGNGAELAAETPAASCEVIYSIMALYVNECAIRKTHQIAKNVATCK